jgi:hypothetical protein
MCTHYRVTAARAAVAARFGVAAIPEAENLPRLNFPQAPRLGRSPPMMVTASSTSCKGGSR